MKKSALALSLIMILLPLAGCAGTDGEVNVDLTTEEIQDLIDENIDDFLNNTTVTVNQENNNNSTTNQYNSTTIYQEGANVYEQHHGIMSYYSEYDKGTFQEVGGGQSTWVGSPAQWINLTTISQENGTSTTVAHVDMMAMANLTNCGETHPQENFCYQNEGKLLMVNGVYSDIGPELRIYVDCSEFAYNYSGGLGGMMPFPGWDCNYTVQWRAYYSVDNLWWNFLVETKPLL